MTSAPTTSSAVNALRYIRKNADEAAVLTVAAKLAFESEASFDASERATIEAMKRAHPQHAHSSDAELGEWLADMEDLQIMGVVSNTKGVLHEMEYVAIENADGDTVFAAMHLDPHHPDTDVVIVDLSTGRSHEIQLKATENEAYVSDWLAANPDGEILVTDELAQDIGLESSGLSNEELTVRTESVVDALVSADETSSIWEHLPMLAPLAVGLVLLELYARYSAGKIDRDTFLNVAARVTATKAIKMGALFSLLCVPGLNVAVAAGLVAKLLLSGGGIAKAAGRMGSLASLKARTQ